MMDFEYLNGGKELIDSIRPMWEKLKNHHETNSVNFSKEFRDLTFEVRKSKFIEGNNLKINIDMIKDAGKGIYVGYCISTINENLEGEIDSIYIDKEYRKHNLGDSLMKRALDWLDQNNAKTKMIVVAEGNENVLEFYKRYGFCTRRLVLKQVN